MHAASPEFRILIFRFLISFYAIYPDYFNSLFFRDDVPGLNNYI